MSTSAKDPLNLRPVILGLCFLWGVGAGFLFHALRDDTPVEITPPPGSQSSNDTGVTDPTSELFTNNDNGQTTEADQPERTWAAPPVLPEDDEALLADNMELPTGPALTDEEPAPPSLALSPSWGLTGLTSAPPGPYRPVLRPTPPPQPPKAPEWNHWDDPDMVF